MDTNDTRHGKASTTRSCEVDVAESSKPFSWRKDTSTASRPMASDDDDLIEYQRSNLIPWLDKKFTLEIHVERLTGDTEKIMGCTFEEGEDDCTMGNVLSRAKDMYPTPKNRRPVLSLCDRVLDDQSAELQTPIRTYLHRYCRDYNSNSTKLQLRS